MSISVAIVGASVSGLVLAHMLMAKGNIDIRVFEESDQMRCRGGCLVLHPSSLAVLKKFGLMEAVRSISSRIESVRCVSRDAIGHWFLFFPKIQPGINGAMPIRWGSMF